MDITSKISGNKRSRCVQEDDSDPPKKKFFRFASSIGKWAERPIMNAIHDIPDIFKDRGWHLRYQSSGIHHMEKALKPTKPQGIYGITAQWRKSKIVNSITKIPMTVRKLGPAIKKYFDKDPEHQSWHGFNSLAIDGENFKVDHGNKLDNSVTRNVEELINSQVRNSYIDDFDDKANDNAIKISSFTITQMQVKVNNEINVCSQATNCRVADNTENKYSYYISTVDSNMDKNSDNVDQEILNTEEIVSPPEIDDISEKFNSLQDVHKIQSIYSPSSQDLPDESESDTANNMCQNNKSDLNSGYTMMKLFKSQEKKIYDRLLKTLPKPSEFRHFTSSSSIPVKSKTETSFDIESNQSKSDIISALNKIVADGKAKLEQQRKFIMTIGPTFEKVKSIKEKCQMVNETVKNFYLKQEELEKAKEVAKYEKQEKVNKFNEQMWKQEKLEAKEAEQKQSTINKTLSVSEFVPNVSSDQPSTAHKEVPANLFEIPDNFIIDPLNIGLSEDDHHRYMFWTDLKFKHWAAKFPMAIPECQLQYREIQTLGRRELIMGDVINAYLNLLRKRSQTNPALPTCDVLSSYFFNSLQRRKSKIHHSFRKRDLFSSYIVLVPFNVNSNHWTLFAIFNQEKEHKILYFDSLSSGRVHTVVNDLEHFLQEEAKLKNKEFIPNYAKLVAKCPQQNNATDCGVFLMANADFISRNLESSFNQNQINAYRVKILNELFMGKLLT